MTENIEWEFIVDRAYLPLSISVGAFCIDRKRISSVIPISKRGVSAYLNIGDAVYWPKGFIKEVADAQILEFNKKGNSYLWSLAKKCEKTGLQLLSYTEHVKKLFLNKKKISSDKLSKELQEYISRMKDFYVYITIPWVLDSFLNESLINMLKDVGFKSDIDKVISKLIFPSKKNHSSLEKEYLIDLAYFIKKDDNLYENFLKAKSYDSLNPIIQSKIDEYLEKYSWVHCRWFRGTIITSKDVVKRLKELLKEDLKSKIQEREREEKEHAFFFESFIKEYSLNKDQIDFINLVKEYVYIRTFRTDVLSIAFFNMMPILNEIQENTAISKEDIYYYTEKELIHIVQEKIKPFDISQRKKKYSFFLFDDSYRIFTGKDIDLLVEKYGLSQETSSHLELQGKVAFNGVVQGPAKIVLDPNDLSKVKKGDVLIAVMTFPSYIVAMEKASAFVTDEGGILCHASIVARELKKPCIINTKNATKVFKDGDLIEVDATKGIIKKI